MKAGRGAAARQVRTALRHPNNDIFSRYRLTEEEKDAAFLRKQPLPEDMPRLPWTTNNGKKPGPSGKPWATQEERLQYKKEMEEWVAKVQAEGRTLTDRSGEVVALHPTHTDEAHKAWLEGEFATMSLEEKAMKGHTVNPERALPYHEFYDHEICRPAFQGTYLKPQKVPVATEHLVNAAYYSRIIVDPDCNLTDATMRKTYLPLETNVPDYRAELAEKLAERKVARAEQGAETTA